MLFAVTWAAVEASRACGSLQIRKVKCSPGRTPVFMCSLSAVSKGKTIKMKESDIVSCNSKSNHNQTVRITIRAECPTDGGGLKAFRDDCPL